MPDNSTSCRDILHDNSSSEESNRGTQLADFVEIVVTFFNASNIGIRNKAICTVSMYVSGFAIKIPAGNLLAVSIYMGFKESVSESFFSFLDP